MIRCTICGQDGHGRDPEPATDYRQTMGIRRGFGLCDKCRTVAIFLTGIDAQARLAAFKRARQIVQFGPSPDVGRLFELIEATDVAKGIADLEEMLAE